MDQPQEKSGSCPPRRDVSAARCALPCDLEPRGLATEARTALPLYTRSGPIDDAKPVPRGGVLLFFSEIRGDSERTRIHLY